MARSRNDTGIISTLLRRISPILVTLLLFLMDTSIVPVFSNSIYMPSFMLIYLLSFASNNRLMDIVLESSITGVLMDITTSYSLGLYTATFITMALIAMLCRFFNRMLGKSLIITIEYILYEATFLAIAYSATIRFEPSYIIPALIRTFISVVFYLIFYYLMYRKTGGEAVHSTVSRGGQKP